MRHEVWEHATSRVDIYIIPGILSAEVGLLACAGRCLQARLLKPKNKDNVSQAKSDPGCPVCSTRSQSRASALGFQGQKSTVTTRYSLLTIAMRAVASVLLFAALHSLSLSPARPLLSALLYSRVMNGRSPGLSTINNYSMSIVLLVFSVLLLVARRATSKASAGLYQAVSCLALPCPGQGAT